MSYGAPITRLALSSNTEQFAVQDPVSKFKNRLNQLLLEQNLNSNISVVDYSNFPNNDYRTLIYERKSEPLYMLLNLANSESHNFTSEVLLRAASGTWDSVLSADKLYEWIKNKGINTRNITIKDGSGLSRGNITTT